MAKISIITPSHTSKWYQRARESLIRQTESDWEWIVLANNNFKLKNFEETDPRIKIIRSTSGSQNVGSLKREACSHVTSPYAIEFDHDDELSRDCVEEVLKAFETTPAVFVYSDDARVNEDGTQPIPFTSDYGWESYVGIFLGESEEKLQAHRRPALIPQNVSRILFAPDHVRAWRMDAYNEVGGHNPDLAICDDLDLMQKLFAYSGGKFHHIPKILYKYYIHGGNTWLKRNREIQDLWPVLHDQKIQEMSMAYCKNWGLEAVDVGSSISSLKLIEQNGGHWPLRSGSVGLIVSNGGLEQLERPIHFFNEAYRVLCHGGLILIDVPSASGAASISSPANKSFWSRESFWNYTNKPAQDTIKHLGVDCRFQEIRNYEYYPSDWHKDNRLPYVRVHLAAIKDGERLHGPYAI